MHVPFTCAPHAGLRRFIFNGVASTSGGWLGRHSTVVLVADWKLESLLLDDPGQVVFDGPP